MGRKKRERLEPTNLTTANPQELVAVRHRRQRVRDMWLQGGEITQSEMAARLGCSQATVSNDIRAVIREWLRYDVKTTRAKVSYRVHQLQLAMRETFTAWKRSQKNAEQVRTEYVPHECEVCLGKKQIKGKQCLRCAGTGKVIEERVNRTVAGQAGDATLMRVFIDAVDKAAKFEGIHSKVGDTQKVLHAHLHGQVDWSRVTPDDLITVMKIQAKAIASSNGDAVLEVASRRMEDDETQEDE